MSSNPRTSVPLPDVHERRRLEAQRQQRRQAREGGDSHVASPTRPHTAAASANAQTARLPPLAAHERVARMRARTRAIRLGGATAALTIFLGAFGLIFDHILSTRDTALAAADRRLTITAATAAANQARVNQLTKNRASLQTEVATLERQLGRKKAAAAAAAKRRAAAAAAAKRAATAADSNTATQSATAATSSAAAATSNTGGASSTPASASSTSSPSTSSTSTGSVGTTSSSSGSSGTTSSGSGSASSPAPVSTQQS